MCHIVYDNNSVVSRATVMLFVPVETGMNALQFTYLMVWWHHTLKEAVGCSHFKVQITLPQSQRCDVRCDADMTL